MNYVNEYYMFSNYYYISLLTHFPVRLDLFQKEYYRKNFPEAIKIGTCVEYVSDVIASCLNVWLIFLSLISFEKFVIRAIAIIEKTKQIIRKYLKEEINNIKIISNISSRNAVLSPVIYTKIWSNK